MWSTWRVTDKGGVQVRRLVCALAAASALIVQPALVAVAQEESPVVQANTNTDLEALAKLLFEKVDVSPGSVVVALGEPLQPGTQVVTKGKDEPFTISAR